MVSDYAEKRNFQRMVIDSVLSFSLKGGSKSYDGNVINLTSKGILFTTTEIIKECSDLSIVLTPSNSITPPMVADAVVTRVIDNESMYEIACTIEKIY
jgi:hypothetical protein